MRLLRIPEAFDHPDFVFEPKIDGFRALAPIEGHRCTLVSRNGHVFKSWPRLAEEIAHAMRVDSAIIDGEICCLDADGRSNFRKLLFRREWPYFYAFDLLALNGRDLRALPLLERMACRAVLVPQFLWASQQSVEKYLKRILLLNRVRARRVGHDLNKPLQALHTSGKLTLDLTQRRQAFIDYLDTYGRFRYLDVSFWSEGRKLVELDQTVWELRRFCTVASAPRRQKLVEGRPAPRVRLLGGQLERILHSKKEPTAARVALLWQNGFFGRRRRTVHVGGWMHSTNAPLPLHPEIFREVDQYVFLPKEVRDYWLAVEAAKGPP